MDNGENDSGSSPLTASRLLVIARRQWWVVLACLVLATGGSLAYVKSQAPKYEAIASVAVASLPSASPSSTGAAPVPPGPDPAVEIKSAAVVRAAAAAADVAPGSVHLSAAFNSDSSAINITATAANAASASNAALGAAKALTTARVAAIQLSAAVLQPTIDGFANEIKAQEAAVRSPTSAAVIKSDTALLQGDVQQQQELLGASQSVQLSTKAPPAAILASGSRKKVVEVAVVAGLLVGLGIALVSDRLDDRLRSASELTEVGSVALLAELPTRAKVGRSASIADNPHDELSEAVRELRTALRFLSVDRPLRTLLVTSPAAGEGKSFVAANLAVAEAISGVRTILVSSDLRRPSLERLLHTAASSHGLSEAIADAALVHPTPPTTNGGGSSAHDWDESSRTERREMDIDGLLVPTGIEDLYLVPAGPSPPNPAELLGSPHMAALLEALKSRADLVILDSPPVLAVTDALVLTAYADGVLLVLAKGQTSRGAARRALRLLHSGLAPVLGVALNRSLRSDVLFNPYYEAAESTIGSGRRRPWQRRELSGPTERGADYRAGDQPAERR